MSVWRTRLTGLALLAFAVAWTVGAFWLIQDGFGGGSNANVASVTQRNTGQNSLVFQQGRGNVATVIQN